jgi:hypothetical protein
MTSHRGRFGNLVEWDHSQWTAYYGEAVSGHFNALCLTAKWI